MEIKEMVVKARKAQEIYEHHFDQDQVDRVIREAARVIYDHAEESARLAVDETGMGVYEHKVAKNRNKSKGVYYNLRGKKSMGIIDMDEKTGLYRNCQTDRCGSRDHADDQSDCDTDVEDYFCPQNQKRHYYSSASTVKKMLGSGCKSDQGRCGSVRGSCRSDPGDRRTFYR